MKQYRLSLIWLGFILLPTMALSQDNKVAPATPSYTIPAWFKHSFLEINEDSKEADAENKHLILFMHLEGCPYCSRMLDENFRTGETKDYIQKNFQLIAINILGDREVQWDEDTVYSEKALARQLKVHFTPTIVFMNSKGRRVLQLNGYRKPATLMHAFNYVIDKQYYKMKLAEYIKLQNKPVYRLMSHQLFSEITDFSVYKKPLAILFENKDCAGCEEFHQKVLQHKQVLEELSHFKLVRLDSYSDKTITDVDGNITTAADWASRLKLDYRPGTVLFDKGSEVTRADGRLYHFHFKEMLRYVSSGQYFEYASYNQYLTARQKELRAAGVQIDYGQ
ncbi:MAG: thioredoxin fold domain-containing protein [Gammaproteobacteria bacterium]|nr:thioredoxin fold domain-containing protein [Gammaproteobacteria bacterium]